MLAVGCTSPGSTDHEDSGRNEAASSRGGSEDHGRCRAELVINRWEAREWSEESASIHLIWPTRQRQFRECERSWHTPLQPRRLVPTCLRATNAINWTIAGTPSPRNGDPQRHLACVQADRDVVGCIVRHIAEELLLELVSAGASDRSHLLVGTRSSGPAVYALHRGAYDPKRGRACLKGTGHIV